MSDRKLPRHMHKDLPNGEPRHAAPKQPSGWEDGSFLRTYPPMAPPKGLEAVEAGSLDE